jgi:hypothetical protein
MTDISKEAVERLAKTADLFASAMKAFQHHTKKHNEDVRDTLRAQAAHIAAQDAKIAELGTQKQSLETDLEDLQLEYDEHQTKVSADFEGACWVALRELLQISGFNDWSDPDGVTASKAFEHIKDALASIGETDD